MKKAIGVAAFVVAFILAKTLVKGGVQSLFHEDMAAKETLVKVAAEVNKKLPQNVDPETELTNAEGLQGVLVYNYRLIHLDKSQLDVTKLDSVLRPKVTQNACGKQELKDTFFKNHVTLRYSYHARDGALIGSFDVTPANCGL